VKMAEALDLAEEELRGTKATAEPRAGRGWWRTARFTTQSVDPFDVLHLDPVKPRVGTRGGISVKSSGRCSPDRASTRTEFLSARKQ